MAGPLRRFLHLERARPDRPSGAAPDARHRFDSLEAKQELPVSAAPLRSSVTDRFRAPAEGGLALDLAPPGEQPFVRCAECEADHERHTARCSRCGAALDTPEQRRFNERLWAARTRETEEEERAGEARHEARQRESEEEARARRALAEAMAEDILRRERERLGESWVDRAERWLRALVSRS